MVENSITIGGLSDFQETKDIISSWLMALGENWIKNRVSMEYLNEKLSDYHRQVLDLKPDSDFEIKQKETLLNLIGVFSNSRNMLPSLLVVLEVDIQTDYIREQVYGIADECFNLIQ